MPEPSPVAPTSQPVLATPIPYLTPSITIAFACPDDWHNTYEPFIETFQTRYPEISVQLISLEEAIGEDLPWGVGAATRLAASADTSVAPPRLGPSATRLGLLRDLTPLIEGDHTFEPDDFWPGVLDAYRWDGGTWVVPAQIRLQMLIYDKDAFDEVGLTDPLPDWGHDDFLATAQALTLRQGEVVERYGFADRYFSGLWGMVNAPWRKDNDGYPIPALDDPTLVEQVQWYADLALRHGVMPHGDLDTLTPVAIRPESVPFHDAAARPDNFGLVPFPGASEQGTPFSSLGYVMSAGTAHPEAAWQWLVFLSRQHVSLQLRGAAIPARRSMVEATDYWATLPPAVAAVCQQALDQLRPPPLWEVAEPAEQAVAAILAGEAKASEALSAAQAQAWAQLALENVGPTPTPLPVVAPQPTRPAEDKVVIKFYGVQLRHFYEEAIDLFERAHPNIRVKLVKSREIGQEIEPNTVVTRFPDMAAGSDCFLAWPLDQDGLPLVLNLEPLLESDPSFSLDDFYPAFLDRFRIEGALHGLPSEANLEVLWYNRALFDAAGAAYPQPGWTPEQFLETAIALTTGEGQKKQYGFLPLMGEEWTFNYFAAQMGADEFDSATYPPRPLFDSPDMIRAVRWYTDLTLRHGVMPKLSPNAYDDRGGWAVYALILNGRAAMWTGMTSSRGSYGYDPENFRVSPLPLGPAGVYHPPYMNGYYISAGAQHPEACWEWIKFLTGQAYLFTGAPTRRSVAESSAYRAQVGEEALTVYQYVLSHSQAQDSAEPDERWSWAHHWLREAVDAVLEGQPVEDALAQAQAYAEGYIQCLQRQGVAGQTDDAEREILQACAQKVDPDYPTIESR